MKYCSKCGYQMTDDMMFCQQCGTKFVTADQAQVPSNTSTERITMNKTLGTKWFTFYTKVRPWFACIFGLQSFIELATYPETYIEHLDLLLSAFGVCFIAILSVVVFIKSKGDYGEFVDFVRIVLIVESITYSYNMILQEYYERTLDTVNFIIYAVLSILIFYFLWYRLNMKYFKKRLFRPLPIAQAPQQPVVYEEPHICISNIDEVSQEYGYGNKYHYYGNDTRIQKAAENPPMKDIPHPPVQHSLSNIGEKHKQYGNYNVYGKDIAYTPAPEASPKNTPPINK